MNVGPSLYLVGLLDGVLIALGKTRREEPVVASPARGRADLTLLGLAFAAFSSLLARFDALLGRGRAAAEADRLVTGLDDVAVMRAPVQQRRGHPMPVREATCRAPARLVGDVSPLPAACSVKSCVDNSYTRGQNTCSRCLHIPGREGHFMRDAAINLRARPEQRDLIDQAAAVLGKNRSDFMLEAACDRAQSVLLDQVHFRLDGRQFKDFIRQLDAPPKANEGLARLMAVKAPWAEPGGRKSSR
jgi:uncharacterized protein (DUF1778 family)